MEWDWSGYADDEKSNGRLTLFFAGGNFELELLSFAVAFAWSQAIDREIKAARVDEVISAYRRIGEVLVPNVKIERLASSELNEETKP